MSFYLFFVKEGTIETSLFSWLRFPTSLRLCHSHVFGGFNHGDVCYKGRKNTQFEDFFFFVEAIGCRRICFLVSTSGWSEHNILFFFGEFSHYGGIGHKQKVAKMIDRKFMDFIYGYYIFKIHILILRDQRLIDVGVFYMASSSDGHKVCKELLKGGWNHKLYFFPIHLSCLQSNEHIFQNTKTCPGFSLQGGIPFYFLVKPKKPAMNFKEKIGQGIKFPQKVENSCLKCLLRENPQFLCLEAFFVLVKKCPVEHFSTGNRSWLSVMPPLIETVVVPPRWDCWVWT